MENWKKIEGYEKYSVSNLGRVRRDTSSKGTNPGRIMQGGNNKDGYKQVCLSKNGSTKTLILHRLVAKAFIPNPENLPEINHLNGKTDNSAKSLEWSTRSRNMQHAYDTGLKTSPKGQYHPGSKLTDDEVFQIKKLLSENLSQYKIAKEFQVSVGTINKIKTGKTWIHI